MIDLRYLKKLVEMLDQSTVDSIELSTDKGEKIRISKTPTQRGGVQLAPQMTVPAPLPVAAPRTTPAEGVPAVSEEPGARSAAAEAAKPKLLELKSPMVGTFYRSPEPGSKPYITEGSRISKGEIVCIIEAMKIMNEIESEYSGVVREMLADDAHPVEYGQVLFRIDPNA